MIILQKKINGFDNQYNKSFLTILSGLSSYEGRMTKQVSQHSLQIYLNGGCIASTDRLTLHILQVTILGLPRSISYSNKVNQLNIFLKRYQRR